MVDNSKNLFSKIINDFNPKDEKQANDLKKILNSYPYFQSASAYYLKSLKVQEKKLTMSCFQKLHCLQVNRKVLKRLAF